ncbi:ATP-binding protein [Oribacterium sp. Sow4_G1_1]|uniref:ATP-binding protein n=1 Tax=Oribacterium sp. Sow4_G1_1 TaxID=3438794 RepID=UPI003F98EE46
MKKRLTALLLSLVLVAGLIWAGFAYFGFVSRTIYEESTAHLTEIFHQANQTLYNLVSVNWSRMRMWAPYLGKTESDEEVVAYVDQAREESHFTDFYFISRNGEYLTLTGNRGYLDLRDQLPNLILEKQPIVVNSVVPDHPEIMVFAIPAKQGSYRGFDYEAIAITYNNSDLVDALKLSAFAGQASTFAVLPDGRVVVDNGSEDMQDIHNLFALLEKSERLTEEEITALHRDFLAGNSGSMVFDVNGRAHYLVYESANFQNWTVLGIVPAEVVNSSMNKLQSTTMLVVSGIAIALAVLLLLLVMQQNRQKLRRKDNELLARDELFSKLSINVNDVFLMLNANDLGVEYVSPNIEKLVGIPEQEVLRNIYEIEHLIRTDESVHILDQLSTILPGEQREWDREYIHQKTGEELWFRVVVFCTDIQGEKKYILDLSDRTKDKKINQRLEDAFHTAENANRAKTTFLNNMSHDIRTPMNAIIGFTNIAMKHEPKPEVRGCLEKIRESSDHLLTLINDVLDISRIESGKIKFAPIPVDITVVADTVLSIMQGFLSNRNIAFHTDLAIPEKPCVLADAVRIREVLVNILGNAVKFTEDGGTIAFEASYHPGADDRHIMVRYRIVDTGVGMREEFMEHIFDEFSQEDNGARTQYKGTGLGMAITKRYVDLMGGTISVESKKGEGSAFTVEIPLELTDESNVQTQGLPAAKVNLIGAKILMAEDNDLNAEIAMVQLEELGIQVTRAADGKEVLKIFASNQPGTFDIIFMDIMMPKMNGYEATKAIRALQNRPDARTIPIIAMTANAFAEDVQASLDAGMNGHIAKPIVIDEVVKNIARNLNR